jgi:tRNA pseudouridine55 synthase
MDGLLLVNKPKNWTSFDVVAKVRGLIKAQTGQKKPKVGHTGTLDPLATGLLVLCLGSYCKKAQEYSKLDKTYEVELKLGVTSTTDDEEGEKAATNKPIPDEKTIQQAIMSFQGEVLQIPPAFSAIKVGGKRAYKLAREGKEVKIEPRKVTIYEISDIKITGDKATFTAKVSSGTYIRSLARDIGEKLGCGAYMTNLRRTTVGEFAIKNATEVTSIDKIAGLVL